MFLEKLKELKNFLIKFKNMMSFKFLIIFTGFVILNIILYNCIKTLSLVKIILISIFIISSYSVIIYLLNIIKNQKTEELRLYDLIDVLEERNVSLMEINDNVRCFKHDFNNIIQAIDGYIRLEDINSLKTYFSKLLNDCNHLKNLEILTSKTMSNPAIYGVLLDKCRKAEEKEINMNLELLMDIKNDDVRSYPLSRIIGILLDNAIEAALECEEKLINIQFLPGSDANKKRIIIENSYKDDGRDIEILFKKDFTTKVGKENSGLGLWKVNDIVTKESEMTLQTTKGKKLFKQELEIYA